jgi:hypothetical protein
VSDCVYDVWKHTCLVEDAELRGAAHNPSGNVVLLLADQLSSASGFPVDSLSWRILEASNGRGSVGKAACR